MKLDEKNQRDSGGTAKYSYSDPTQSSATQATTEESFSPPSVASRARNRTVMLTPDVTGQVRNLLQNTSINGKVGLEDNFQKPNEMPVLTALEEPGREENATSTFAGPVSSKHSGTGHNIQRVPLMEGLLKEDMNSFHSSSLKTDKSDKVEGTLELKHEHFRRATSERMLEELGIGVPQNNQNFLSQSLRDPTATVTHVSAIREQVAPEATQAPQPLVTKQIATSRIIGFLVSYDNTEFGEVTELRVGRWLVSSKANGQKDVLVFEDTSISALHAVIKVSDSGIVQIMDQLSDKGSGVLQTQTGRELDASESAVKVQHGDLVRFGSRYFVYCAIPKIQIEN